MEDIQSWSVEYYERNTKDCDDALKMLDNLEKIPLLNSTPLHDLKDGQLVRYVGMIQDMLNPEYYYSNYNVLNQETGTSVAKSGKFRDLTDCEENENLDLGDGNMPKERQVFFCIPVPGENAWVHEYKKKQLPTSGKIPSASSGTKRPAEEDMEVESSDTSANHQDKKRLSVEGTQSRPQADSYNRDIYFPIPGQFGLPCLIKIYEDEDKCEIMLNDRVEVIGFLSLNPALEATWQDSDAEDKALHPPPSLVPRIHTLSFKKIRHCNPYLKQAIDYDGIITAAERTRSDLHLVLTQVLYGDTIAADYLICHLLSRIYIRSEVHTLGHLSLNISNVLSQNYGISLYDLLQCVVTNSQYIPLSIQLLNEGSFIPKKDYELNRLKSGRLQLSEDTHVFLDETKMNEGKLNHMGCLNIAALQNLVRDQEIRYDFGYYPVKYNTNIPVLVVSEGKSMFETTVRLKLKPDHSMASTMDETFSAAKFYLNGELVERIRTYLTAMRLQEFQMTDEMTSKIGEDYVAMRQQDSRVSSCDLHQLLVLSRLLALSHGRNVMSPEDWSKAVDMETERKAR